MAGADTSENQSATPAPPNWMNSTAGVCDGLLPGWQPIQAESNAVRPWGRQYLFDGLPAPVEVMAAGASLLTGPIRFVTYANGQEVTWNPQVTLVQKVNDGIVKVSTSAESAMFRLTAVITAEFDGMLRSDWQLVPKEKCMLESLALEIPFKSEHARYLYSYPGKWGSAYNAGATPATPTDTVFRPFVWMGDEERGFCWFSESDRNFFVNDPNKVTQIIPGEQETLLRINIISTPTEVAQPLDYTFGFQATPVRDNPQDVWDFRICHHGNYGIEDEPDKSTSNATGAQRTMLDRLADLGVRTICFHEHWTDIQNYTSTTHGAELTKLVKACHARNIRLIPYFGYEMSNIAPEWKEYSEKCLVAPRAGGYHRLPEQNAYIVCYRSEWKDFIADGIAKAMDEYDLDGVYLDGTADPWECKNVKHGCGYAKPDGTIGGTYPIFATRDIMKRIWTIVKTRKPNGMINVHQSTVMTIPTIAFATSYWDGEQFGSIERGPWSLDVLPMEAFRCEFMGHQWGVPAELLCYNKPYTYSEAMSFSLLHDVLVRGNLGGGLELESKLWKAMDLFGRKQAKWLPYWNNQDYVTTDSNDTKASLYARGKDGAVIVFSNLGKENRTVQVRLNLKRLELPETLNARDIVNECPVSISPEGGIEQTLKPLEFRAVWIK